MAKKVTAKKKTVRKAVKKVRKAPVGSVKLFIPGHFVTVGRTVAGAFRKPSKKK